MRTLSDTAVTQVTIMSQSWLSASCLCKGVQYTVSGVDKGAVLCHCNNCQKASGSAFAHNYRFLKANIDFAKGEDLVKEYKDSNTKTGNTLSRHFCTGCVSLAWTLTFAIHPKLQGVFWRRVML